MTVPKGFLPVFSCDTEEEAQDLITLACARNYEGDYIARELVEEQTQENLAAFSIRLQTVAQMIKDRALKTS